MSIWSGQLAPSQPRGRSKRSKRRGGTSAPVEVLDRVNRALALELGLSAPHREHLLGTRGLPPSALEHFATLPDLDNGARCDLARRVAARAGCRLAGVPGWWRDGDDWCLVPLPASFLVPVKDAIERLLSFQARLDAPSSGQPRYVQLSSARWAGGTSSGVPASSWRTELRADGCWIVEGHLKAAVAAHHLPACTIGVAGVANWRPALDVLRGAPAGYPVTIAYDAPDVRSVPEVWRAREALAEALGAAGLAVRVATWDRVKGIDDALLAGMTVSVEPWSPSLGPLRQPACRSLPPLERPVDVGLAS